LPRIVNVFKQVLAALAEAHAHQIIHRDLKPENVVLEPLRRGGDFVKVVDFGLAKLKAGPPGTSITSPGIVCGTPDYMAPEQGRGDDIDGRSDLYALGVVLFWLLTGRLPFEGTTPTQVVLMHIKNPVPDPRELAPHREISDTLLDVIYKALAKDANQRYQDAFEFADALELVLEAERPKSPVPSARLTETVTCATCANQVPSARFCMECGARLGATMEKRIPLSEGQLPLMSREDELTFLQRCYSDATKGLKNVRIFGEAGVGKTRLATEFQSLVKRGSGECYTAGPDPYWAEVAGYMLRSLVEKLVSTDERQSIPDDPQLQYAVGELWGPVVDADLSAAERLDSFSRLLLWALETAAAKTTRPLLVVIDDIERVDGLSRQALASVVSSDVKIPCLMVGLAPPSVELPWPGEDVRVLGGLSPAVATKLLQDCSEHAAGITLVEVGNRGIPPLYVAEALALGLDGGTVPPARLPDLIAVRLAALDPEARRLVQAIAVFGEQVEEDSLKKLLDCDELNPEAMQTLIDMKLLLRNDEGQLTLNHPLIQELSLHATPAEVRRELHDRAARILQDQDAPMEALAYHFTQAGDSTSSLFMIEHLANRAQRRGDTLSATQLLRRGLELAREELYKGELDNPMRAITIFGRKLGQALNRQGRFSDAEGVLLEVLDGAPSSEHGRREILENLAVASRWRSRPGAAADYLRQAIEVARAQSDHDEIERLEQMLGDVLEQAGMLEEGGPRAARAE
jgi:serine/threonine-protein kinase